MLLQRALLSVGKRTCFPNGLMLKTIEDHVFSAVDKKCITTVKEYDRTTKSQHNIVEEEYEKTINALNTLQSNADTIRRSIASNNGQSSLDDSVKYLLRSGLNFEDLERLSFIHVSGTKGKGSTCALTESILRSYGNRTGFFSSPHLVSVTERIRINGQPIPKQRFTQAFWRVFKRLEKGREHAADMPAYFKFLTILSFHIFLEEQVDVTLLEVGIGGELDCTNIIRHTQTVGITSLGLEHTQLLGHTLQEIAWQKAGIIKTNSNVYTTVLQPECLDIIRRRAAEKNATLYIVPEFSKYMHDKKSRLNLEKLNNVTQLNGSLAIQLAYDWLRNNKKGFSEKLVANTTQLTDKVMEGLNNCSWPGRCQIVNIMNFQIHLDGAHTIDSMCVCGDWFYKTTKNSQNSKVLIFNTTGDRDSKNLLEIIRKKTEFEAACFVPNIASGSSNNNDNLSVYGINEQMKRAKLHAGNWHLLCEEAATTDNCKVFGSILDSLNFVRERFGNAQDVDVLVTGSLHLIGATVLAVEAFKRRLEQT